MSVAADKGYDAKDFVAGVRELGVTPHVAAKQRGSAIDGRTSRHASYATSLRRRKLIEEGYGWMKDTGGLRKLRHRGQAKVSALFTFTCAAYNLVRLRKLLAEPSLA
jgi:IS5 family transposase